MKKSDVLRLIEFELAGCANYDVIPLIADHILTRLIEVGFAPPIDANKSWKLLEDGSMTYDVREWEPEDSFDNEYAFPVKETDET